MPFTQIFISYLNKVSFDKKAYTAQEQNSYNWIFYVNYHLQKQAIASPVTYPPFKQPPFTCWSISGFLGFWQIVFEKGNVLQYKNTGNLKTQYETKVDSKVYIDQSFKT